MKLNAKLLVVAMVIAVIFSIGAVSASGENVTALANDFTQVPHEQVVSVSEPTVQEVGATDLETSVNSEDLSSSDTSVSLKDSKIKEESNIYKKGGDSLLGASNENEILGTTRYVSGNNFTDLSNVIDQCNAGDVIDLQGNTFYGKDLNLNKNITLANGVLESNSKLGNYLFRYCTLENLTLKNFATEGGTAVNFCTLNNVHFDGFTSQKSCDFAIRNCTLDNVNFTNCHALMPADPNEEDFETGVMIVTYHSRFNNCHFINCSSNRHSGAICVAGQPGNTANITNCVFDNCSSGVGGAIYLHGTGLSESRHSNVINCTFTNCVATEWGGAIGSSQDYLNVENCDFINNSAKQGAAFMVGGITHGLDGDNSQGHFNTMRNCYLYNNTGSEEGGAVHITGHNNTAIDCTFDDNFAINGKGAAIYVEGNNASVISSSFTNHKAEMGTVYIEGKNTKVISSDFKSNTASHGGAGVYIEGDNSYVYNTKFEDNNASMHGGAIHTIGSKTVIDSCNFYDNNAIPRSNDLNYGLGGAVFINGSHNLISNTFFGHNTARNGSAIYTTGHNLTLVDDEFHENQAWSYFLFTDAHPPESYWSEDLEVLVNVTLIAGDNIINAIYNNAPYWDINFHNVTYEVSDYSLYNSSYRTTTDSEIHPENGAERSNGGRILYQDAREDNQKISLNITYGGNKVFSIENLITNIYGNVLLPVTKEKLAGGYFTPGVYNVSASHPEDMFYTVIDNSTTFRVLPHVDVSVTKTSNKDVYFVGENAIFTITVNSVGTNATDVKVKDILPKSFEFVSANATQGTYNSTTNEWYIGFLPHGASKTLTLIIKTTQLGTYDNVVNATCYEKDWNLSNNVDNKTIHVNLYYTKEANLTETSAGEYIEYYLRVFNTGKEDYTEVIRVLDIMPAGIRYVDEYRLQGADLVYHLGYPDRQIWDITNITAGAHAKITVKALALTDGIWNNTLRVNDYPPVNSTVNVTSSADLQVIKDVIPTTVSKGDVVNWTITVINHGPSKAFNVYVDDLLPKGLEIVGYPIPSRNTRYDRISGKWTIGNLDVGEYVTLIISTKVTISAGNITNVAVVNSTTPDPDLSNNKDNDTIYFNPDVSITKLVSTKNTYYGDIVSWTINVTNNGPNTATGVYVIDKIIINGLRYINSTYTKGTGYNPVSGRWTIGNLNEGESAVLVINTEVTMFDGLISNNATVYATNDNDPDNNYAENFTQVRTEADVSIVKLVSNQTSHYGDEIFWTIIVTNNGPNTARDVVVIDFLPNTLQQTREPFRTKGTISHAGSNGKWNIGTLEKGENATLIVYTKVMTTDATIINVVNVTTSTYDPDLSNNEAENGTYVPPECDVQIVKTVSNFTPNKGDKVIWTIEVINVGPNVANNVVVTDILPAGRLKYVSHERPTAGSFSHTSGIWTIGTLEVNSTKVLTITTTVEDIGNITNEANVTTTTYDVNLKNNYDNETVRVSPATDLEIIKIVSDKNPRFGDVITWTITVINHGPNDAYDVNVTDKLPAGLVYQGDDSNGKYNSATGVWDIGTLAKGADVSLVISTLVNITNATITNVAVVNSTTPDNNESNNKANNTTHIDPEVDLEIIKLVSNATAKKGDVITWTIIVTNKGPDVAVNVVVKDKLPNGLTYNGHNADEGLYDNSKGIWKIGQMKKDDSFKLVISTIVTISNGNITNIVNVTSDTPENNTDNNKANNTTNVAENADLEVVKIVSNKNPHKGDIITWTITVTNHGPSDAKNVRVIDKLPAGLVFKGSDGIYDPQTGLWIVGNLTKGQSKSLVITTLVNITNKTITNIANVTSDTPDSNETNNKANNTTDVSPEADLEVVKIVSNKNPHKGDVITWTITVTNRGPDAAINVKVTDKLPAGLVFKGADGNYNPQTGLWIVGNLIKGQSKSLVITTLVNITNATIRNVANVTSDTYDPNKTNDEANNTTNVSPEVDLEIIKLVSNKTTNKGEVITWTIIVSNNGPDTALNVYVCDELPSGLIYNNHFAPEGLFDKNKLTWYIKSLAKGKSATLTIDTLVNVSDVTLINKVNVTNDVYDSNETNNKANNTTDVGKELPADLEVIKIVSNKNPHNGDTITWTITVTNNGPGIARDVTVTDKLPDGLRFISSNGNYNKDTGIWTIGDMKVGDVKSLIITTVVTITNANITNIAVVNSTTPDNNTDNNEDNDTTSVDPEADLKIIKTVSDSKPSKGDTITWTIVVVNLGPDTAYDVVVSEDLPDGLKLLKVKGSKGSYNNGIWTVGTLNNGEMATLTITTEVLISGGTIENVVVVTSSTYDPDKSNNNDTEVTNPKDSSDDEEEEEEESNDDDDSEDNSNPDNNLSKAVSSLSSNKMHATGNPIVMILLALLAVCGIGLRRRI